MATPRWTWTLFAAFVVLWLASDLLVDFFVDALWFGALGFTQVFRTTWVSKVALFVAGFGIAFAFLGWNARSAAQATGFHFVRAGPMLNELQLSAAQLRAIGRALVTSLVVGLALLFGLSASGIWLEALALTAATPFGETDPVFNLDISFYVFTLPVARSLQAMATTLVFLALGLVTGIHAVGSMVTTGVMTMSIAARKHIVTLGGLLFTTMAVGYFLARFELLFHQRGVVFGAGWTALNGDIPALWVQLAIALGAAGALFYSRSQAGWGIPATALAVHVGSSILVGNLFPSAMQSLIVDPNELELETPFLLDNIKATRKAYALDRIEVRPFQASETLTLDSIQENPLTIDNIRIWDTRPLLTTYGQLQEIRLYYDFHDVDVDRYTIDGQPRQVMLSARELDYSNVPGEAQGWVNEHFQYTHGYGLTMSPVNVVTPEGLPALMIQDIPPVSIDNQIPVDRPEIYYGELTDRYVFVGTNAQEFDYPKGDENAYTRYEGVGGVPMGGFLKKVLFSLHFQSFDILLSQYLTDDSKVMFRRRISERLRTVLPFLRFDGDPYLVVHEGRLMWIADAYTITNRYPYAAPTNGNAFNYIRNSVKATIDAYDGSVRFYIADDKDPLVQTYSKLFPDTFQPLASMPEGLQGHIRYPADFFDIQADRYRAYHMNDANVFYNREDMWEIPTELYAGNEQQMASYYLIMKLPDEDKAEFILLVPFVPTRKDNMIAWMAARSDPPNYGRLIVYQFPKQKLIFGPRQIEARIDQNPEISEMITLWSQAGSRVVRGNLLVIPIEDSLIYVEPIYLQAESSQLPELKRVVVSYETRIVMRETLDEALAAIFGEAPPEALPTPEDGEPVASRPAPTGAAAQAHALFLEATQAQKQGNWAAYGEHLKALGALLSEMVPADLAVEPEDAIEAPEEEATPEQ